MSARTLPRAASIAKHLLVFAAVIALWEGAAAVGLIDTILLPQPHRIAESIWELYVENRTIYRHFAITFYEAAGGFLIGGALGLALAVGSALNNSFRRYVAPYAILLNVTPGLALTPIVIAWFGFGYSSKIALGAIVCFFPVFVNTLIALTRTDEETTEMFRSMGASEAQLFWKLRVPAALPMTFAGFKIAVTTALVGAVVAEFSQATAGVGVLMQRLSFALDMGAAIAALLSMSLLGLILFTLIEMLDDRIVFWRARPGWTPSAGNGAPAGRVGAKRQPAHTQGRKNHMTRLFTATALGAMLAATGVYAQDLTTVNAVMPKQRSANYFPLIVGEALGYFEEEGIEVNLLPSDTPIPFVNFLRNGQADIAMLDSAEVLQAVAAGVDLRVVYEVMQTAPDGIAVSGESAISDVAELEGETVGLVSDRDRVTMQIALDARGMTEDDVTTVVVGEAGPTLAAAFRDQTVAAIAGSGPDWLAIRANGIPVNLITPEEVSNKPGNTFAVAAETLEEKPE